MHENMQALDKEHQWIGHEQRAVEYTATSCVPEAQGPWRNKDAPEIGKSWRAASAGKIPERQRLDSPKDPAAR